MQGAVDSVLVDPKFKEQFEIAHPTARYAALLDEVPACFVGTEERLVALVELLCSEMSSAFRGTGVHSCLNLLSVLLCSRGCCKSFARII